MMNERIRELAKQAGLSYLYDYDADGHAMVCSEKDIKKFAELIVQECLDINYRESHLPNAVLFDERSDKFIKDIHNRVSRATREHFGVKE